MRTTTTDPHNGIKTGGRIINKLQYADDTTLITESLEQLKTLLTQVRGESSNHRLYLKLKKTKLMTTSELANFKLDEVRTLRS